LFQTQQNTKLWNFLFQTQSMPRCIEAARGPY
jgi:hypothetical protein